ncbi:MAG: hypothetical protein CM1200mP1_00620 [Candidatus Neomarinimicrobiota bacterium]|nr:MAG: hypothetical protein CM1200mP1_00620 [Candidatus Neomarinimicrobiota bacterium]
MGTKKGRYVYYISKGGWIVEGASKSAASTPKMMECKDGMTGEKNLFTKYFMRL